MRTDSTSSTRSRPGCFRAAQDGVKVEIKNPTKFDARVSIFAENAEHAQKPQGYVALLKWPKMEVKAGETKTIFVSASGETK